MLRGQFPNRGLRFLKGEEKPPFMTFAEVQRRIAAGAASRTLGLPPRMLADASGSPRRS